MNPTAKKLCEPSLDGRRIDSREAFWREYVDVVRPEGADMFGRNLDAFNDALSGGLGWPGDDVILRIMHPAAAIDRLGLDFVRNLDEISRDRIKIEWLQHA